MLFSSYHIEGTDHQDDLPLVVLMPIIWQKQYFKGFCTLKPLLFPLSTLFSFNNHTVCSPPLRGGQLRSIPWRVDHLHKLSGILPHRFVLVSHLFLFFHHLCISMSTQRLLLYVLGYNSILLYLLLRGSIFGHRELFQSFVLSF